MLLGCLCSLLYVPAIDTSPKWNRLKFSYPAGNIAVNKIHGGTAKNLRFIGND